MRRSVRGLETKVEVSWQDMRDFKARWPCSGLPDRSMWFVFDGLGDLTDRYPRSVVGDGDSLNALVANAREYGSPFPGRRS